MTLDPAVACIALTALAGCLGWGIRGVFGHQTGAMIPGALMGAALAASSPALGTPADTLLLAAVGAAAFSIGGVMTYGQTLGLTHNQPRPPTYWWGITGCLLKGGLWFGMAAALLGLAVTGNIQRLPHVAALAGLVAVTALLGKRLLNCPFDPPRRYPLLYFSRRAYQDVERDPPRREYWGGLLFGLLTICLYSTSVLDNQVIPGMAAIGFAGGGLGFAVGQALQAWGIWRKPCGDRFQPWIDWWKVMEMTFGCLGGAGIGLAYSLFAAPVNQSPPPADVALSALMAVAWLVPMLAKAHGSRLAARLCDWPTLMGMVMLTGISAGPVTTPLMIWAFLPYISAHDTLQRWRRHISRLAYLRWYNALATLAVPLTVVGVTTTDASAVHDTSATAPTWLLVIALSQTFLTAVKALGEREPAGFRAKLSALKSAWVVELGFVALTILLYVLAVVIIRL